MIEILVTIFWHGVIESFKKFLVNSFLAWYDREFPEVLGRKQVLVLKFLLDAGVSAAAEAAHGLAPLLPQLSQGVCR